MGSREGCRRAAAKRLGMTYEAYAEQLAAGNLRCTRCRAWHPAAAFPIHQSGVRSGDCLIGRAHVKHWHTSHSDTGSAEHQAWCRMIERCTRPTHHDFMYYGGRGITVHPDWLGPDGYARFLEHIGRRPSALHTLDRMDNVSGYAPGNVRWATRAEQSANRRSCRRIALDGRVQTIAEWSRELSVDEGLIRHRLNTGATPEFALQVGPVDARLSSAIWSRAKIVGDEKYRYLLEVVWDETKPIVGYVGLNPSTASASKPDHTCRKFFKFAMREGAGGFAVANLFALRSRDPAAIRRDPDPVGPRNEAALRFLIKRAATLVFCWGAEAVAKSRTAAVATLAEELGRPPMCFGTTDDGAPRHPLYLPNGCPLVHYQRRGL